MGGSMDFTIPEDLKQIQMLVRRFVREQLIPIEDKVDETGEYPEEIRAPLIKNSMDLGIRNMGIPEKHGGGGIGILGQVIAHEEAGWASEAVTYTTMTPHQADTATLETATKDQLEKYFYPTLKAEREGCGAWTEPDAGGDAAGIQTRAVRKGDDYILNGTKIFVTNADKADHIIVGAVTGPDKPKSERFTLKSFELVLEDCKVP